MVDGPDCRTRIVNISPWELVPGMTKLELIGYLTQDEYIKWVADEKASIRARHQVKQDGRL